MNQFLEKFIKEKFNQSGKVLDLGAGNFQDIKQLEKIEVCYLNPILEGILPYSDELELWQELEWIKLFKNK